MSNENRPFGLRSLKTQAGADVNGQAQLVHFPDTDATAAFMGTPVVLSGDADEVEKCPNVATAPAGGRVEAIIAGFRPNYGSGLNNDNKSRAASTKRYAYAQLVGNGEEFAVQANAPVTTAMVGQLFDLTAEAGNGVTGHSTVELDIATASAASGQVQLMRVVNEPDNEFGPFADCVVRFNESAGSSETDGV